MRSLYPIKLFVQSLAALIVLLCAGACAGAPAAQSPTHAPGPTSAPAAPSAPAATHAPATHAPAPTHTPGPTDAPTAAPQSSALLPAPLYYIDQGGQIWRIERDGQTRRQITFETFPIVDFDVGAGDNALVYVVNRDGEKQIVRLDASGRREMVSGPVASPRLSPDGERMAFELNRGVDGMQIGRDTGSDTGIYMQYRSGGRPGVLQASDPISDTNNPPTDARQYYPIAWSPDGTRLLIGIYYPVGEGGTLAVKPLNGDGAPVAIRDAYGEASWSLDGASVVIAGGTIVQDALLGLWRADPRSGAATALLLPSDSAGSPLVTAARQLRDGTIYAFLTFTHAPSIDNLDKVAPYRVKADGSLEQLRKESYLLHDALWADDARGAVIAETTPEARYTSGALVWLPMDGGAPVALGANGLLMRWGTENAQPRADACGSFSPIAWEPPDGRTERPEAIDVQRRLLALGYAEVGTPDGLYGDQTRAAVRAYQSAGGLPATGDVDCATWQKLLTAALPRGR